MMKILLVDDEREEREGITYLIQKYEYPLEITEVANGQKALEYVQTHSIDILFTDIKMPFLDGLDLAKAVHEYNPSIKIIIFSAYGEFDYAKRALEANAVSYLLKPIELEEFQKVMTSVISSIKAEKAAGEKQKIESDSRKKNLLYRIFTSSEIPKGEEKTAEEYLFPSNKSKLCMINIEFLDNYYEANEEYFLKIITMYLGNDIEYINLFQNESFLLIRNSDIMKKDYLEGQLTKIMRDIKQFTKNELYIIVGQPQDNITDFKEELNIINTIRNDIFGFADLIIWTDSGNVNEHYVLDVEVVKKQLLTAIELNNSDLIRQFGNQLVDAIISNNVISKIYIQNMFYSIIYALYEKNPNMRQEEVIKSIDKIFQLKNARKIIEELPVVLDKMLNTVLLENVDNSRIVQKIINLVEKEYRHDISLNYIADSVNLAPAYVSYIFKKETGKTLIKYITDIKMAKAKILLEEGNLKIVEVARECGYDNQSYFNRLFKNYYGITPKQFRER